MLHAAGLPRLALRRDKQPDGAGQTSRETSRATGAEQPSRLLCVACRHPVTTGDARTEIGTGHRHTFCNPHGLVFNIACFGTAPGAASVGAPEAFFSWFPGYAWRIAVCRGCAAHLGWSYGDEAFWGLIEDRLVEDDAS